MSDEKQISDALRAAGMWLLLIASSGGVADYLIQLQRGIKPTQPFSTMLIAGSVHVFIATFIGVLCALVGAAWGHTDPASLGAAAGAGGLMGSRSIDIAVAVAKAKGVEFPPPRKKK